MKGWTRVDCETTSGTAKALELNFNTVGSDFWVWVPRSCYRVVREGKFDVQYVKTWFVSQKNLWNRLNVRCGL